MMRGLFRFGIKVGILSGAVYYSKQVGVWDDSSRTYQLSQCLVAYLKPYVKPAYKKVENELPFKVEELPSKDDICRSVTTNWNKGVIKSISFTQRLPCIINSYVKQGTSYIQNELKKN